MKKLSRREAIKRSFLGLGALFVGKAVKPKPKTNLTESMRKYHELGMTPAFKEHIKEHEEYLNKIRENASLTINNLWIMDEVKKKGLK